MVTHFLLQFSTLGTILPCQKSQFRKFLNLFGKLCPPPYVPDIFLMHFSFGKPSIPLAQIFCVRFLYWPRGIQITHSGRTILVMSYFYGESPTIMKYLSAMKSGM